MDNGRDKRFEVPFPAIGRPTGPVQATRKALIDAAADAFSLNGFDGVTIRDVERRAGVNRGLVGHHFGSKSALWEATVDTMMNDMIEELQRYWDFLGMVSTPERGRILLRVYVHFIASHPEFFRLILIEGRQDSQRSKLLVDRCMRPLEQMFRAATGAPEDAPVEDRAVQHFTLFGAASAVFGLQAYCEHLFGISPHDPDFIERFADAVTDIWERMYDGSPAHDADTGAISALQEPETNRSAPSQ